MLCQAAATRGPWKWAGASPIVFYRSGRLYTPWGSGRWSLAGDAIAVTLGKCRTMYRLVFNKARTSFAASAGRGMPATSHGTLVSSDSKDAAVAEGGEEGDEDDVDGGAAGAAAAAKWRKMSDARIYRRLLGSGPWSWTGVAPVAFLGGGLLHTPWGAGTWSVDPKQPESTIYANFVGEKHVVTFDECWTFQSVRERDGDKASGVARIEQPVASCPAALSGRNP